MLTLLFSYYYVRELARSPLLFLYNVISTSDTKPIFLELIKLFNLNLDV